MRHVKLVCREVVLRRARRNLEGAGHHVDLDKADDVAPLLGAEVRAFLERAARQLARLQLGVFHVFVRENHGVDVVDELLDVTISVVRRVRELALVEDFQRREAPNAVRLAQRRRRDAVHRREDDFVDLLRFELDRGLLPRRFQELAPLAPGGEEVNPHRIVRRVARPRLERLLREESDMAFSEGDVVHGIRRMDLLVEVLLLLHATLRRRIDLAVLHRVALHVR